MEEDKWLSKVLEAKYNKSIAQCSNENLCCFRSCKEMAETKFLMKEENYIIFQQNSIGKLLSNN